MLMQFLSFLLGGRGGGGGKKKGNLGKVGGGGGGGGGAQIRCIMGNVEVAYRRLSVVLDTVYNFYLRHVV